MDLVVIMLFTQQVFQSQSTDLWKSCLPKKNMNFVLQSSEHEELTFLQVFIFVFIPYFIGLILSKKMLPKVEG